MGNDPKQGEDFVKVPLPKESDDVEAHRQGIDPKQGEDFLKVGPAHGIGRCRGHSRIDPKQGEDFLKS